MARVARDRAMGTTEWSTIAASVEHMTPNETARCLEVEWHGLDRAAAIRLVETVQLGRWSAIYEVDALEWRDGLAEPVRHTKQYLVSQS